MSTLPKLIDHLEWADAKALGALRAAGMPDGRAREIYSHILGSEHTWISRITERTPAIAIWPTLTDAELDRYRSENVAELRRIIDKATEVDLARVVSYRTSAGHPYDSTVEDILLHVALHGSYHRGQVAMLLRQGGAEPAATDYIAFIRGAPAATRASVPAS
jgi:uncharacterized damage-inducible protein DinB